MLKSVFLILLFIHSLIHLMGFAKAFEFGKFSQLNIEISKSVGLLWLGAGILITLTAVLFIVGWNSWWLPGIVSVILSQSLIILAWQDAKFGTAINLILILVIAVAIGKWNFEKRAQNQAQNFIDSKKATPESSERSQLPAVVSSWNETCASKENFSIVKFVQRGKMKTSVESSWKEFRAEQWSSVESPEFIWKVDVGGNTFMQFSGLDKLMDSEGSMQILAYGLVPVVKSIGKNTDEASAIRYLAEMVWYPETVGKLPVKWESLNENRYRATLETGEFSVSGIFTFDENNKPAAFEAMRHNDQTGKAEKWVVAIDTESYFTTDGATIPAKAEITWELDDRDFTWYQVEVLERKTIDEGK